MNKLFSIRRTILFNSLALAGIGLLSAKQSSAAQNNSDSSTFKTVFQVSDADPQKWQLTLANAKNLQIDLGEKNGSIEIVAYGPGIAMFKAESEVAPQVLQAMQAGVLIRVCENSMHGQHLKHEDMISAVGFVPSGVGELVRRQAAGYAYIRS
ncbi:DsrE family protein [Solimicrobium silvestre]|uniref:Uncharacterized protein n=1 Tax=Solimicrobium silvestre TaxID=2099400 RepID=A0A2S9H124_9BURK|nr:DsrE family protein [Solimicrobium silvestre]PRC93681.1 hypothetical protein S2091_1682 [Solimicrobium silvestre]